MSFLEAVADKILRDHSHHLRDLHIISPNRRALLFLQKILARKIDRPIWSPVLMTMDDLVQRHNTNLLADPLILNYQLYQVWRESGSSYLRDRFDQFYFWGQVLLRDFDDIDKHRINHKKLFRVLKEDMQMEMEIDGWTEEDRNEYSHFLRILTENRTDLKANFENIWQHVGTVYSAFKEKLASQNIAYNGMLYNYLATHMDQMDTYAGKPFVFVGFNRLNACEKLILGYFRDRHKAQFYWNFDTYLLIKRGEDAGKFLAANKRDFPDDLGYMSDMATDTKQIKIIEVPFLSAQSQIAADLLQNDYLIKSSKGIVDFNDTLIMLPNERLLTPLMQNIPSDIDKVNISIGLPVSSTGTYRIIEAWIHLHSNAYRNDLKIYYKDIESLVFHPFLTPLQESFHQHFQGKEDGKTNKEADLWGRVKNKIYFDYEELNFYDKRWNLFFHRPDAENFFDVIIGLIEWLYNETDANTEVGKVKIISDHEREILSFSHKKMMLLRDIFSEQQIRMDFRFMPQLVSDIFTLNRLPFRGEPLNGLQVLGTMEARNLSFEKVIIPSVEEGYLPAPARNSFIPYSIRRLFRFPDAKDDASEQAYYFYSTLQNAKEVTLLYSQIKEGLGGKEKSRFLHQIMFWNKEDLKNWEVKEFSLDTTVSSDKDREISFIKTDALLNLIDNKLKRGLSASSLNDYLDCSLRFYFKHIRGWREDSEVAEELDFAMFGSVLHKTLELLYKDFEHATVQPEDIDILMGVIENTINEALSKETGFGEAAFHSGPNLLFKETLKDYVFAVLEYDKGRAPFVLVGHEFHLKQEKLELEGFSKEVRFSGFIDRLEREADMLRIIDYKTGKDKGSFRDFEDLFSEEKGNRPKAVFQALLYVLLADQIGELKSRNYSAHIFKLRDMGAGKQESTEVRRGNEVYVFDEEQRRMFRQRLAKMFEGMFDKENPLKRIQSNIMTKCAYCAYRKICDREFDLIM